VAAVARGAQQMPWQMALCGGEDFELVLAVAPAAWPQAEACAKRCGLPLTVVGRVTAAPGIVLLHAPKGAVLRGFDHFAPHADSD
jgi:thiamine-monophosphate kinase